MLHLIVVVVHLDFYEEILTLVDTLTINTVSPLMWQVFYLIKEAFYRDAADYFAGKNTVRDVFYRTHAFFLSFSSSFIDRRDHELFT
jgi:hypothetical protein